MSGHDPQGWPEGTEVARALCAEVAEGMDAATAPPVGARTRVWSRVEARRAARTPSWLKLSLGVAGAMAGVLAVLVAKNMMSPATMAGARFEVAAAERIDVHGAAAVVLDGRTRATVERDDAAALSFRLDRGSLLADVEHRPAGAPFLVQTPRATVKVVGTVLWVSVDEAGEATVLVGRGAVEVQPHDGRKGARVAAGERWPRASTRAPSEPELSLLSDRLSGTRFAPPALPGTSNAEGEVAGDGIDIPVPGASPASPRAVEGSCAGLKGAAAVACYRELAGSSDPLRAESALFEMGWRQLREVGDARAALATWSTQRTRFPDGALRLEADTSIVQAAFKLDDRSLTRREAEAWLRAHEGALLAPEIHFLLGAVLRADGDCAAALPHFDAALKAASDPWAKDARAFRAACASR